MLDPRLFVLMMALLASGAHAQWLNFPAPGTPRTRDGKPDLTAKTPRASNGKPDLSGVWQTEFAPAGENASLFGSYVKDFVVPGDDPGMFSKYFFNVLVDFKPERRAHTPRNRRIDPQERGEKGNG